MGVMKERDERSKYKVLSCIWVHKKEKGVRK